MSEGDREDGEQRARGDDAVVLGGGLVGVATALALAKQGLHSVIVDASPLEASLSPDFDGRAYAIALASRRFLRHLGVWDAVEAQAQEIREIVVTDGRPGEPASPLLLRFDPAEMSAGSYGHLLEDHVLRRALYAAALAESRISLRSPARAVRVAADADARAQAVLEGGDVVSAPVLIGCDGRNSRVARALGAVRLGGDYDQIGLVCAVAHEKPHGGVAHELFLPSGPFAILPLTGDRSALVWTERKTLATALREASDEVYLAEVRRRFGGFLGALRLTGKRWVYPLGLSVADRFVGPRLALAGDAARGVHPIAGQGLNYGFRDAAALAEVLGEAAHRGEDLGALDVLRRYERWRRADSLMLATATDSLNRLFSNDIPPLRLARRLGLRAFGAVGPLRRAAMRFASGDRRDLPRSMQG